MSLMVILGAAMMLAGCASMIRGTTEMWVAQTDPIGATLTTSTGQSCKTPCILEMARDEPFTARIEVPGYDPVEMRVESVEGGGDAAALSMLGGGLIGTAIDGATGANRDLKPNPLNVTLTPAQKVAQR
jgi:hypothetical protein